jgi:hypothetical protein
VGRCHRALAGGLAEARLDDGAHEAAATTGYAAPIAWPTTGLDDSPAGDRVVTFTAGVPTIAHRERMVAPHLELVAPRPAIANGDVTAAVNRSASLLGFAIRDGAPRT